MPIMEQVMGEREEKFRDKELIENLQEKLNILEQQRRAILNLLATLGEGAGQLRIFDRANGKDRSIPKSTDPHSLHSRVILAALELCDLTGGPVTVQEILNHAEKKGIALGEKKRSVVAGIISREIRRRQVPRLRKSKRGKYEAAVIVRSE
jgi:hypothetical protein